MIRLLWHVCTVDRRESTETLWRPSLTGVYSVTPPRLRSWFWMSGDQKHHASQSALMERIKRLCRPTSTWEWYWTKNRSGLSIQMQYTGRGRAASSSQDLQCLHWHTGYVLSKSTVLLSVGGVALQTPGQTGDKGQFYARQRIGGTADGEEATCYNGQK